MDWEHSACLARTNHDMRRWHGRCSTATTGSHRYSVDVPWLEKPPLYYWQAMLAYSAFGVSDSAARMPSAFDATCWSSSSISSSGSFVAEWRPMRALITASCAGIIGYARAASMDMPLTAAFAIGMLAWWAWRENGAKIYLAAFYMCAALGMLAKGPVAPFLAAACHLASLQAVTREWRLDPRTLWFPGVLLFCLVALPWYLAVQMRNPEFFREFILQHNLARFSSNLYHHPEPFWYYLPVVVARAGALGRFCLSIVCGIFACVVG